MTFQKKNPKRPSIYPNLKNKTVLECWDIFKNGQLMKKKYFFSLRDVRGPPWPAMQGMVSVYHTNGKGWYFDFSVYHTAKLTQTKLWRPISQAIQTFWKFCSNRLKAMVFYFMKNLTVLICKKWKLVKKNFILAYPFCVYHIPCQASTTSLAWRLPHP